MKKRPLLGIFAIILTAIACYVVYYKFWLALVGFAISAVALPFAFYFAAGKFAWFGILFAAALDLAVFWQEYSYYEGRGLFICATVVQLVLMSIITLVLTKPKRYRFWVSLAVGLTLFAGTIPFYHDMYIPKVFTGACICLNGLSALLFGKFLYCVWAKRLHAERRAMFAAGIIFQAVGHGVFAIMNWGSWLFLGLSVMALSVLTVSHFKEKKKGDTNAQCN